MPLGTLDRAPPPLFRQGLSALTKLGLYSSIAIFLMVADTRLALTGPLRNIMATLLLPVQQAMGWPDQALNSVSAHFAGLDRALAREQDARKALARQAERSARVEQLTAENQRLRVLLDLRAATATRSQAAEILYEASDPYSRKVIIDRGSSHGIAPGSPVITEAGVLGQVSRVYLITSEVTLVIDRDAAIPVLNARTGHRAGAFGGLEGGLLELRFVAANDDVRAGDALTTSGVDGIYPPGLAVATVQKVDRRGDAGFARITLAPAAVPDGVRHVLVLEPVGMQLPPKPPAPASAPASKKEGRR